MSAPRGDLIPPSTLFAYPEDHARSHPEKPAFPAPRSVSLRNSHVRTAEVGHVVKSIETLPSSRSPVPRRPDPPHHHRRLIEGIVATARWGVSAVQAFCAGPVGDSLCTVARRGRIDSQRL